MKNFFGMEITDLQEYLAEIGGQKFRAQQLFKWAYEKSVTDIDEMTNLSKKFREALPEYLSFDLPKVVEQLDSVDGTRKLLCDMGDGQTVETVLIPAGDRLTICLSSEVGCNMACKFCYTGKQKLKKRLTAAQIVGQFWLAHHSLKDEERRITNIVFMGMGEPLDNSDHVFKAIEIMCSDYGFKVGRRRITVSTSGIVPEMHKIRDHKVRLAVSLNASNDEIRDEVMPINKRWDLKDLLTECKTYAEVTKEYVTFEYVMLKDVTDTLEDARRLPKLLKGIPCKINLIPFNEHPGAEYKRPDRNRVLRFQKELMGLGVHTIIRRTMGRDIFAACGQLTSKYEGRQETMDVRPANNLHI
ncbi:MAG: 23S rRNA (adenine(2503)-C(2))-methyltransferase RlmN [Bdellovibrionales bacterium]